ncbi:hypothetical protein AGOR_G00099560 [Albula goreensis]|uniref:Uncharacterized protein n=1 Tax=Albula goreensis TaxID=1534307 RepID=A0A8T3DM09_9TELE|nr:hypothetical protein AGOR_G00099560 [Albula goreensis]
MTGDYVSHCGPMGMGQSSFGPPQMPPHSAQLRHGPPVRPYIPGPPHHPAMLLHGGPPPPHHHHPHHPHHHHRHPAAMPMPASSPPTFNPGDPAPLGGQVMDIL